MSNKIMLAGVQGTGKSTLLKSLQKNPRFIHKFKGVFLKEVVRTLVKERGVKINKEGDHASQMLILEAHYIHAMKHRSFITDRGALDAFTYATYNYLKGQFSLAEHMQHEEIFVKTLPYYTNVIYLPIEFPVEDDGFRDTDEAYRWEVDNLYNTIIEAYKINSFELRGSVEERTRDFFKVINFD